MGHVADIQIEGLQPNQLCVWTLLQVNVEVVCRSGSSRGVQFCTLLQVNIWDVCRSVCPVEVYSSVPSCSSMFGMSAGVSVQ